MSSPKHNTAVIGSGPAGLMAAWQLVHAGVRVTVFDKRKGAGWKLFIAGSSGLNITNSLPLDEFRKVYSGPSGLWERILSNFSPDDWLTFIHDLGQETFEGTSGRFFVTNMNAAALVREWKRALTSRGVTWTFDKECRDFAVDPDRERDRVSLQFTDGSDERFDAVCFALGGGSYEPGEKPLRWPKIFCDKGIGFAPFSAANVGFQVAWNSGFLQEAEGLPIKDVRVMSGRGSRQGDVVVTAYGLEGTPIYTVGETGPVVIDLQPNLTEEQITARLRDVKENLSPLRRVQRKLSLCSAALALLYHHSPPPPQEASSRAEQDPIAAMAALIKAFPLTLGNPQSLDEAISSRGGVKWDEVTDSLMLRRYPGVYVAGEMLDWEAPTGGFLIQGCVSMGAHAGRAMVRSGPHP